MPFSYSSFSKISHQQILEILSRERWYSNERPRWKNLPTITEAILEREKRARLFQRNGFSQLGNILESCVPNERCGSGACPECGRALQRFFVRRTEHYLQPSTEFSCLSLVPTQHQIPFGKLSALSILNVKNEVSRALYDCKIPFAIGGLDFSFNEDKEGRFLPHWSPHFWLSVPSYNRSRWEILLRRSFPKSIAVPRPIRTAPWDGSRRALGYAVKTDFQRRITYDKPMAYRDSWRMCRNSRKDRLRAAERVELYQSLHHISPSARIILLGVDPENWLDPQSHRPRIRFFK